MTIEGIMERSEFLRLIREGKVTKGDKVKGVGLSNPELVCVVDDKSVITLPLLSEEERPEAIWVRTYISEGRNRYGSLISRNSLHYDESLKLIQEIRGAIQNDSK